MIRIWGIKRRRRFVFYLLGESFGTVCLIIGALLVGDIIKNYNNLLSLGFISVFFIANGILLKTIVEHFKKKIKV